MFFLPQKEGWDWYLEFGPNSLGGRGQKGKMLTLFFFFYWFHQKLNYLGSLICLF